jgi:hypothetical protein
MVPPDLTELHDRYSRGEPLSAAEYQRLTQWYATEDATEAALLFTQPATPATVELQQQIAQTAQRLEVLTQQISATITANQAMQSEIALLHRRIAQRLAGWAA